MFIELIDVCCTSKQNMENKNLVNSNVHMEPKIEGEIQGGSSPTNLSCISAFPLQTSGLHVVKDVSVDEEELQPRSATPAAAFIGRLRSLVQS